MKETCVNTVHECRKLHKMTQEDLAAAVGVSRQTIIAIEKGHYTPLVLLAIKLARALHTSVEKLFFIEEVV